VGGNCYYPPNNNSKLIVIRLEIWVNGKGGTKNRDRKRGGWGRGTGAAGFMAFVHVWEYFCCCNGGCLWQELQGAVYSWYSRLVSGCVGGRGSVVTGWGR
jgi:hypothetical protein